MNVRIRTALFLVAAAGVAVLIGAAVRDLPSFGTYRGPYGDAVVAVTGSLRQATNAVTTVVMDVRAIDTIGEEFILLASAVGVLMVLRKREGEPTPPPLRRVQPSAAMARTGALLIAPGALLGAYLVAHGQITPGGGFQGGVVLATPTLLLYVRGRRDLFEPRHKSKPWEIAQAAAVLTFVLIGFAGLVARRAFLANIFGLGHSPGTVFTSGSIPILNVVAGVAVSTAVVLIVCKLLEELGELDMG